MSSDSLLLRFVRWIVHSAFQILIIAVIVGFLVWLFVIKLGYGVYLQQLWDYFKEFLGFAKDEIISAA